MGTVEWVSEIAHERGDGGAVTGERGMVERGRGLLSLWGGEGSDDGGTHLRPGGR